MPLVLQWVLAGVGVGLMDSQGGERERENQPGPFGTPVLRIKPILESKEEENLAGLHSETRFTMGIVCIWGHCSDCALSQAWHLASFPSSTCP